MGVSRDRAGRGDAVARARLGSGRSRWGKYHRRTGQRIGRCRTELSDRTCDGKGSALVTTLERHERVHGSAGFRYALTDANGHPLAGDKNLSDAGRDVKGWKVVQVREPGKTVHWHVLVDVLPTGENLVIAQDAQQRRAFRLAILEVSGFAILLAALACTGVGLVLSVLLLRRA